jgi:mannose-1-phosphate guanylyltransferase / phosphomannomutase
MSKTRLTITIAPEVISELDKLIDGKIIRNRSHAIESLVNQQLMGQISQAVILAGGSPSAIDRALTKVAGQPILTHTINLLLSYGLQHIFIITDQDPTQLEEVIGDNPRITLITQKQDKGTAGALAAAVDHFAPSPIIVMHSDIFTDINLLDLIRFHRDHGQEISIAVKPKLNQKEFGKAIMSGNRITKFLEKPSTSEVGMVNIGIYVINPSILRTLPKNKPLMLETDVFPKLAEQNQLGGYLFEGLWYDITAKK